MNAREHFQAAMLIPICADCPHTDYRREQCGIMFLPPKVECLRRKLIESMQQGSSDVA